MHQPTLAGERLALRPLRESDAAAVYMACQDEAFQRFTNAPVPYRIEHARDFIAGSDARWRTRSGCAFAVVDQGDHLMGSCGTPSLDPDRRWARLGYWVAPWARGVGVASEALDTLSTWLLTQVGFATLELEIEPGNVPSLAVAARAGYVKAPDVTWEEHRGTARSFTIWQRTARSR